MLSMTQPTNLVKPHVRFYPQNRSIKRSDLTKRGSNSRDVVRNVVRDTEGVISNFHSWAHAGSPHFNLVVNLHYYSVPDKV